MVNFKRLYLASGRKLGDYNKYTKCITKILDKTEYTVEKISNEDKYYISPSVVFLLGIGTRDSMDDIVVINCTNITNISAESVHITKEMRKEINKGLRMGISKAEIADIMGIEECYI